MATMQELERALINADAAGDVDAARQLAAAIRQARVQQPQKVDLNADNSVMENIAAGAGKAVVDSWRGIKQLASKVGIGDEKAIQQEIDDAKQLDQTLMNTKAGVVGNIGGHVAMTLLPAGALSKVSAAPRMAAMGQALLNPTTYRAAMLGGAAMGALQPVASDESRAQNTLMGAAGGGAGLAVGRGIQAGFQGAKSMIQPLTEGGREKIAGDVLRRATGDQADDVMKALAQSQQIVPGSMPTAAEASQNAGVAALQQALAADPAVKSALADRAGKNMLARVSQLDDIAGDEAKREFFKAARDTNAKELYDKAFKEQVQDSPWIKGQFTQLMERPSFQDAVSAAQRLAADSGIKLDPKNQVQVAHYTKLALDDAIESAPSANAKRALIDTRDKFLTLLESEKFAPSYREARLQYAADSAPINQMEVGQYLKDKLLPAVTDNMEGAPSRVSVESFSKALRNADDSVRAATGRAMPMEKVMTPEQMGKLGKVAQDLARMTKAQDLAKTTGSTTAQNLVTKNMVRQIAGPLGAPESFAETAFLSPFMKGANIVYGGAEEKTRETLAKAMMEPDYASKLMNAAVKNLTPAQIEARKRLIQIMQGAGATTSANTLVNLE